MSTASQMNKRFARVLSRTTVRMMERTRIRAGENIVTPGSPDARRLGPRAGRLTNRSGRLLRALVGARGRDASGRFSSGSGESRMSTQRQGDRVVTTFELLVPYAGVHEYGGTIPSYSIIMTPKMRGYLWRRYYETKLPKYKFAALKRGVTIPARKMEERPFVRPAIDEVAADLPMVAREEVEREFGRLA